MAELSSRPVKPVRGRMQRKTEGVVARISRSRLLLRDRTVLVPEFPKSGGTWLSKMIGCGVDLPVAQQSLLPLAMPVVLHGHFHPSHRLRTGRTCLIYRDGRDCLVSLLHHLRRVENAKSLARRAPASLTDVLLQPTISDEAVRSAMAQFIEWQSEAHTYAPSNWSDFNNRWLGLIDGDSSIPIVCYEDLLDDPVGSLARVYVGLGESVSDEITKLAVRRFDFEVVTGRARGTVDASSFLRSGTQEQWRSAMDDAALAAFDAIHGTTLSALIEAKTLFEKQLC